MPLPLLGHPDKRLPWLGLVAFLLAWAPTPPAWASPAPPAGAPTARPSGWAAWWALAQAQAPSLKVAEARLAQAWAAKLSAAPWLGALPELNLALGPRTAAGQWDADALAGLQGPWPQPALREARLAVAEALRAQLQAEARLARRALRQSVKEALAEAWGAEQALALAEEQARLSQELARVAERRRQAGLGDGIEAHLAEAEAASARLGVLAQRQAWRLRQGELAATVGVGTEALPPLALPPLPPRPMGLAAAQAQVAARHPRLVALAAAEAEAEASRRVAEAGQAPAPTWGLQYAREGAAGSPASHIMLGSVGLPWPGGRSDPGALPKAEAWVVERQWLRRAEAMRLNGQTEALWHNLALEGDRLRQAQAASQRAEAGLALLRRAVVAGELSLPQAGTTRRALMAFRAQGLEAQVAHHKSWAAWEGLVGVEGEAE